MSDDLVARLRHAWDERERQLDEDFELAQVANALTASPWISKVTQDANGHNVAGRIVDNDGYAVVRVLDQAPERAVAMHIARHDPARVLAEVERGRRDIAAKRRILAHIGMVVISPGREALPSEYVEQMEVFLRLLAEAEGLA